MSSLLEQAIVEATALKQAATKNAEKNLIDKYSDKIKKAVDRLLEQDLNLPDAANASTPDESGEEGMDAASALENIPSDLSQDTTEDDTTLNTPQKKDPLEKVKSSFMMNGKDDELITIDFSSLKSKPVEEPAGQAGLSATPVTPIAAPQAPPMGATPVTPPAEAAAPAAPMQEGLRQYENEEYELSEDFELEEEMEEDGESADFIVHINEEEMCEGGDCGDMSKPVGVVVGEDSSYGTDEVPENLEEEEELEEEFELEESLIVDMEAVSDGWRGAQPNERREIENVELARLQDEEVQLKIREYEDAVESAHKKIKKASKEKEVLMKENSELRSTLLSLKEHIEKMNLSNAKLLYMNRALGNTSLNERQKQQIVESISKTDSVEGAKIAFDTLQGLVRSSKNEVKTPKSLNEAVSKSSSPFLVRKTTKESPFSERMKVLAGIK